jgi:hypothetical protein
VPAIHPRATEVFVQLQGALLGQDMPWLVRKIFPVFVGRGLLQELRRVLRPDGRLVVGEHFLDPDFVSLRSLKVRAATAGLALDRMSGTSFIYLARFRPQMPAQRT